MLGYRGHFSTKSRLYSVTLTQLRQARADHRAAEARQRNGQPEPDQERQTITVQDWRYTGAGLLHGEHFWAEHTRNRIQTARRIRREITQRDQDRKAS